MADHSLTLALAQRAQAGDQEALEELVDRERARLFALAYSELRSYDDAQDAVAAALVRVCLHVGELRDATRVREWLNAIVRNEARRIRRRQRPLRGPLPGDPAAHVDQDLPLRVDVARALRNLPAERAHCITLFYVGGLTVTEVAGRMRRPEGTVKRWLHEGRRSLAHEMEAYRPMELPDEERTAAVLGDPGEEVLGRVTRALLAAGFTRVLPLTELPPLEVVAAGDRPSYHLPASLRDVRLVVLDDRVAGGRWLEQTVLMRATEEGRKAGLCLLLSSPPDLQIHNAWVAGCDLCFTKETLDEDELRRLIVRWLAQSSAQLITAESSIANLRATDVNHIVSRAIVIHRRTA